MQKENYDRLDLQISSDLTVKQIELIRQNLLMGETNQAEAARRAGYSPHTARQIASFTLKKPHVAQAIVDTKRLVSEKLNIDFENRIKNSLDVYALATERDEKNNPRDLQTAQRVNEHLAEVFGDYAPKETRNTNQNLNLTAVTLIEQFRRDY